MDEIKDGTEVCIRDLKKLGLYGGCTAILDDGQVVSLKAKYGTIEHQAIIAGQSVLVDLKVNYKSIYKQIRVIKRKKTIIARKIRLDKQVILKLTGKGYHRTFQRKDRENYE